MFSFDVTDEIGQNVPTANYSAEFEVEEPAEIMAIDNGDLTDLISFSHTQPFSINGKALIVICPMAGKGAKLYKC